MIRGSAMAGLLPAGMRCSCWWYAMHRGLPQDLGYLKALGLIAARMARWEGLEEWRVPERHPDGVTYLVCQWPERIWDAASAQPMAREAEFWSYPAPPEDTQAYQDWCQMADEGWANPYG
jgi:hypothetical protein